ncbi:MULTISPECIES: hypothetical protein [Rhodococcus]|uniref:hypothetical protein n=1 Tax=Rhodococcus TaxID=1827 RepID=UPI00155A7E26|nr:MULTISPECIES: hypothetical protein [Rhodococcus]QQZ14520.1 hypothetical protein GO592_33750 [Rhodococcus sp. 21391]
MQAIDTPIHRLTVSLGRTYERLAAGRPVRWYVYGQVNAQISQTDGVTDGDGRSKDNHASDAIMPTLAAIKEIIVTDRAQTMSEPNRQRGIVRISAVYRGDSSHSANPKARTPSNS